jgi:hypothetical protein
MAKTINILAILFFLMGTASARVLKNGDYVMGSNALRLIEEFHTSQGRLPVSWEDIRKNYYSPNNKHLNQSMTRLGFIRPPIKIQQEGDSFLLISMDISGINYGEPEKEMSRLLLFMNPIDNTFQVKGMSESRLRSLFAASGINLDSYSSSAGNWANSAELDDSAVKSISTKPASGSENDFLSSIFGDKSRSESVRVFQKIAMIFGFIILVVAVLIFKKRPT